MKAIWKQLVTPHIDSLSLLPVDGTELADIENLQRSFTNRVPAFQHLGYWDRKAFQLSSQQRKGSMNNENLQIRNLITRKYKKYMNIFVC